MMSASTLTLDLSYDTYSRQYELSAVDMGADSRVKNLFKTKQDALHFSGSSIYIHRSQVFTGSVTSNEDNPALNIICKFVEGDVSRLRTEAEFYATTLKNVQGVHVPILYGYFAGRSPYDDTEVACILLQNCGLCLSNGEWTRIPMDIRVNALNKLLILHSLGICHHDFGPRSVLIDASRQLRIFDFDYARLHECHVKRRVYSLYELEPLWSELDCIEVRSVSLAIEVWTPRTVDFEGISIEMTEIKCPEDLANAAQRARPISPQSPEEWLYLANEYIKWYNEYYLKRIDDARASARKAAASADRVAIPDDEKSSVAEQLGQLSIRGTSAAESSHAEI